VGEHRTIPAGTKDLVEMGNTNRKNIAYSGNTRVHSQSDLKIASILALYVNVGVCFKQYKFIDAESFG
jgi:hypothetical protein